MEEKLLYKIYVTGHVQGVGFRWSAAREARNYGLNPDHSKCASLFILIIFNATDSKSVYFENLTPGNNCSISMDPSAPGCA